MIFQPTERRFKMRLNLTKGLASAFAFLCLTACASRPSFLCPAIPAELLADCVGVEETDIGTALENRSALIACERDKTERLNAWGRER